jgi:MFS family permease
VLSLAGNLALTGLFEVGIPLLLKHWVGLANGPQALGIVVSGFGLGSVLGAASAALAARARHKPVLAVLLIVPMIGAMIWAPFAGGPTPMALAFGVGGLFLTISNVLFMTVIQRFIPMEMMGRMMSITMLGSFVGTPLSIAIYGAAATVVPDTAWLFFAGSLVMTLTVLAALVQKVVWETA